MFEGSAVKSSCRLVLEAGVDGGRVMRGRCFCVFTRLTDGAELLTSFSLFSSLFLHLLLPSSLSSSTITSGMLVEAAAGITLDGETGERGLISIASNSEPLVVGGTVALEASCVGRMSSSCKTKRAG